MAIFDIKRKKEMGMVGAVLFILLMLAYFFSGPKDDSQNYALDLVSQGEVRETITASGVSSGIMPPATKQKTGNPGGSGGIKNISTTQGGDDKPSEKSNLPFAATKNEPLQTNVTQLSAPKNPTKKEMNDEGMHLFIYGLSFLFIVQLGLQCYQIFYIAGKRFDAKISQQATIHVSEQLKKRTEMYLGTNLVSEKHFDAVIKNIENHVQDVKLDTNTLTSEFDKMRQSSTSMNTALDLKDKRINDLEAGIDLKFKKLFATSFLKPYRRLVDVEYKNIEPTKTVEHMKAFLLEAMGLCDIQPVPVDENTVYSPDKYVPGSVKVVQTVQTDKQDLHGKIIKVLVTGYLLTLPKGGAEVISPSEVSIYLCSPQPGVPNA